jgi:spermidine/putrescine-binding protein
MGALMRRSLTLVLVLVAFGTLAACSKDDSSNNTTSASTTTILTPSGFTGQDSEAFCKLARDYSAQIRAVGANVSNPAQLKNVLAEVEPAVSKAVGEAPSEIKPDVQYLANSFKDIRDSLDKGEQLNVATLAGRSAGSPPEPL